VVVVVVVVVAAIIMVITKHLPHPPFRRYAVSHVSMIQSTASGTEITASCVEFAYFSTHLLSWCKFLMQSP
jgi:hypothetical protein